MQATNPNTATHPYGTMYYHLSNALTMQTNNQGCWIKGERLTRKALPHEKQQGVNIKRALMVFSDGRYVGEVWMDIEFQTQCLFNAVVNKVIGTAFALRCLDYYQVEIAHSKNHVSMINDTRARILKHSRSLLKLKKRNGLHKVVNSSPRIIDEPSVNIIEQINASDAFDLLTIVLNKPELFSDPEKFKAIQARNSQLAECG